MGIGITCIAVKKENFAKCHEAVQKFINYYLEEDTFLGQECYIAVSTNDKSPWYAIDDEDYSIDVFEWIEEHPDIISEYHWE